MKWTIHTQLKRRWKNHTKFFKSFLFSFFFINFTLCMLCSFLHYYYRKRTRKKKKKKKISLLLLLLFLVMLSILNFDNTYVFSLLHCFGCTQWLAWLCVVAKCTVYRFCTKFTLSTIYVVSIREKKNNNIFILYFSFVAHSVITRNDYGSVPWHRAIQLEYFFFFNLVTDYPISCCHLNQLRNSYVISDIEWKKIKKKYGWKLGSNLNDVLYSKW